MKGNFFLGLGVQKCASTWLYDILLDHPQVALSERKEMDFFSYHYGRGYQWYESHFPSERQECLSGEISPSYFIDTNVPRRLQAYAAEPKILVSLRDPVERAISNHRHEVRLGNIKGPDLSFEAGVKNNPLYIEQSRYGSHLRRWLRHFPSDSVLIVFQDDIVKDPLRIAQQVYRFLDIDVAHISRAVEARSNESHVYRFDAIERLRRACRGTTRLLGADGVWRAAQAAGLQRLYRRMNRRPPDARIPPVAAETKRYLRRLLEDEVRLVEEIAGRQLLQWRQDGDERSNETWAPARLTN